MLQKIFYIIVFAILFLIGLRNTTPTVFDLYIVRFTTPLMVLLFAIFILGVIIGILSVLPKVYKQHKIIKDNNKYNKDKDSKQTDIKTK